MGPVLFALGYLVSLIAASTVSVYSFNFVEPAWGPNNSFQVLLWISLVATFLAAIAFGLASALARRFSGNFRCVALGVACAVIGMACLYGYGEMVGRATIPVTLLAVIGPAMLATLVAPRHGA